MKAFTLHLTCDRCGVRGVLELGQFPVVQAVLNAPTGRQGSTGEVLPDVHAVAPVVARGISDIRWVVVGSLSGDFDLCPTCAGDAVPALRMPAFPAFGER